MTSRIDAWCQLRMYVRLHGSKRCSFVMSPARSENYVQPGTEPPADREVQRHRLKLNLNDPPPSASWQPDTPLNPQIFDPGQTSAICPFCGLTANHTRSSLWWFVCANQHHFGPRLLAGAAGPGGVMSSGASEPSDLFWRGTGGIE
jgi:hypothetical protein